MASAVQSIVLFAVMATIAVAAHDVDAIMTERPEGVSEAVWSEEYSTDMLQEASDSAETLEQKTLRGKQAVAAAHVNEDKASLALSDDAQSLEHLKGQMSLEVVHAKLELKRQPTKRSAAAHRAASLAKQVMSQTRTVQKDHTNERLAKLKVHEAEQLLAANQYMAGDKAKEAAVSSHMDRAANALKKLEAKAKAHPKKAEKEVKEVTEGKDPFKGSSSDDTDPISRELGHERDKYRSIEHSSAKAVEGDKHDVAESETTIQDLSDKLAKEKEHLRKGNLALKKHMQQHALTEHLYLKYSSKETHYKKMHALKAQITRQEDQLRLQQMKIRDSKEMLSKSLSKEQTLAAFKVRHERTTAQHASSVGYSTRRPTVGKAAVGKEAIAATPAVNAAVDAVSANLGHMHIAKQLEPQIAKLKASGLKGEHLKMAIDQLVASTVKSKVSHAFQSDPTVSNAVRKAAAQVRARRSQGTASNAVLAAKDQVTELDDAGRALHAAESKLDSDQEEEEEEMVQDLEQVWGSED